MTDRIKELTAKFAGGPVSDQKSALTAVESTKDFTPEEKIELAEAMVSLFYQDHADDPELGMIIARSEKALGSLGSGVAGFLLAQLAESDAESAKHFARAIGSIGASAVDPLLSAMSAKADDDYAQINMLLAVGNFRDPAILKALPKVLKHAGAKNHQLKAAALYCIGRLFNRIPYGNTSTADRSAMFDSLFKGVTDPSPLVRRHAVRALGKGSRNSYFTPEQVEKTHDKFRAILGTDTFNWDTAFIVRSEAEKQLHYCRHGEGEQDKGAMSDDKYRQDFKVLEKRELCPNTFYFKINAPLIARKIQAGQFIIMRPNDISERMPLSIAGWDRDKGYLEIIIMGTGRTSTEAVRKNVGDCFQDIVGPLGQRSHVAKFDGACVMIGGGYGTGAVIPTARDCKALGNKVYGVVGARQQDLLIMVDELKAVCDEVFITTNDGSVGIQGFVTHALEKIMAREKVSMILAVGPVPMMMAVTNMTREMDVQTWVSLNAIMVDGTGMCGACRVSVGGKTRFACYHGPDFIGKEVDFDELMKRQKMFVDKEKIAFEAYLKE
jgi:ferredoxin--NADP+ reductase